MSVNSSLLRLKDTGERSDGGGNQAPSPQTLLAAGTDGDEPECNHSGNARFTDMIKARLNRREVLVGGLSGALATVFNAAQSAQGQAAPAKRPPLIGFKPVPVSQADAVTVPEGYRVQVILPWGEPIRGAKPRFDVNNSGADQALQIGMHHDGMHYFPITGSSADGLLVINHEYVEPRLMHASARGKRLGANGYVLMNGRRAADEVLKELNAHGVSIVRIRRQASGAWVPVDDPRNRRITGLTPMEIRGPVRGSEFVITKYSPNGTRTRGTLSNCAHGATPWNTYLAAEENWAGYFRNGDMKDGKPDLPREHARYGIPTKVSRYGWELADNGADEFVRFDASRRGATAAEDYRNEPNTFGYMVEIDPFKPDSVPIKRTALGRFAHEGVVFAPVAEGRPVVCYSGDDAANEYIYKFVSADPYYRATAGGHLLDRGTLYVARFNDDGTGEWIALVHGRNGLTAENGFRSQAEVVVNTRAAADFVKATRMDRPEWGAVDPQTGAVYFTLSNNSSRQSADIDKANPRANNIFGHIIRWNEQGRDHTATKFTWDIFVLAGDADAGRDLSGKPLGNDSMFACPDGLWFDRQGRLWIQTDISESVALKGPFAAFGNNAMLCADPKTGEIRRFLTGPIGQEITGVITTPDSRTMFVNVQHPGASTSPDDFAAGRLASHWPEGGPAIPRSATLVITKTDGGVIGT
jgi:secreted PhoX family phosphatase